ncbi:MAG: hypothetical protein HYU56_01485 [Candidatus Aenigmarchaeota archaeon]|nr:hypothetical protein [Candidatus Aenigmarchaeota archaeon]
MKIVFELDTDDTINELDLSEKMKELKEIERILVEKNRGLAFEKGNVWIESRQKSF